MPTPPTPTMVSPSWVSLFIISNLCSIALSYSYHPFPYSKTSYTDHCNQLVPQSPPSYPPHYLASYPQFSNGYYTGGDQILNQTILFSNHFPKSVTFRVYSAQNTETQNVYKISGVLHFLSPYTYQLPHTNVSYGFGREEKLKTRGPRVRGLRFNLQGYWSQDSGKLCMVGGSSSWHTKEGILLDLSVVFKLNYPKNSSIYTSLVKGSLESVDKSGSLNYFDPISLVAFYQLNYDYSLVLSESKNMFDNAGDGKTGLALTTNFTRGIDRSICSLLQRSSFVFELEYGSDCNDARNCSPIDVGSGFWPDSMSFSRVQCSEFLKLRMLIGFYNTSFSVYDQPMVLDRMLVGEGVWDEESNRLNVAVCRILNFTGSLVDTSVGDCSIRLSLWFPGILSIKTRSSAMGRMWSNNTVGDPGYFGTIGFRSSDSRKVEVPGLKYEYTEIERVKKLCVQKKVGGNKGKKYPRGFSYDMMFSMMMGNGTWGTGVPLTLGKEFFDHSNSFSRFGSWGTNAQVSSNQSGLVNMSYIISLTNFKLGGTLRYQVVSTSMAQSRSTVDKISAEGVYDTETGGLCMIGCRYLASEYHKPLKNNSMDCEILINVQFPESNAKSINYVKGSIKSTRERLDPLYFEKLEFASLSLSRKGAKDSAWRMDLEITMGLITNTLICVFAAAQLFYVKKHPDVLSSISLVMLVILTLGHMIPLVLNFEALFLTNRNRQHVLVGSGGWLEVNEVIVRVVTMIAFLLQFYLLQQTWSSRLGDGNQKALWLAEKKTLFVFLPLCLLGGFIAGLVHWQSSSHKTHLPRGVIRIDGYQTHSLLGDLRSYAGLLLDGFLLPQILLNGFWNSKDKALSCTFYLGTTAVRLVPHAYDLYRTSRSAYFGGQIIYANHGGDFFSTAWDIIIPCGGLLFAVVIYFQQRFGGSCILPPRFRASAEYEKVPVLSATGE